MNSTTTKLILIITFILVQITLIGQDFDPNKIKSKAIDFPKVTNEKIHDDYINFQVTYDIDKEEENWTLMSEDQVQLKEEIGQLLIEHKEAGNETNLLAEDKNFNSLRKINNPENFPFSNNCKLKMRFENGWSHGSAVIIDAYHILTAAHCVYDYNDGTGWAKEIYVFPAYDDGRQSDEYGYAKGKRMYSFTGYTNNGNLKWDIALVKLDRPIGVQTGWITYGYNNSNSFFKNNNFHNGSYPAESPYSGKNQYYSNGDIDNTYTHKLRHDRTLWKGMSGSGMYYKKSTGKRIVYGIASHRVSGDGVYCRINSSKFNSIKSWINSNTSSRYDLSPHYMENSRYGNQGGLITNVNFKVLNEGRSSFSGTMTAKFYLSKNDNITTYDTEIGTLSYDYSLSSRSKKSMLANNRLRIPSNLTPGTYYLGVILTNQDGNVSNNKMNGLTTNKITIYGSGLTGNDDEVSSKENTLVETLTMEKRNSNSSIAQNEIEMTNYPNPFYTETTIKFNFQQEQDYSLEVFNDSGKRVFVKRGIGVQGDNNILITDLEIPLTGKYIYTLKTTSSTVSSLLIKI